jgi:DNA-binding winged helix-turn-helix (wHTH) protein
VKEHLSGVQFGPFHFEPVERRLLRDGHDVALPPKAADLLAVLIARAGRLVTRDTLLKEVWPGTFVEEANLSYTVSVLRKALGDESTDRYIDTVQKRGYRFIADIRTVQTSIEANPLSADTDGAAASDIEAVSSFARRSQWTRFRWYSVFAASVLLVTGPASMLMRDLASAVVAPLPRARFDIPVPDHVELDVFGGPTISPDGRQVVVSGVVGGKRRLVIRSLESAVPLTVPGTEGAMSPFWSPDSRTIGFFVDGKLKTVLAAGGRPVLTLCDGNAPGAWGAGGVIVFSKGPLYRVADTGGVPERVTTLDKSRGESSHGVMGFLSDARRFVFSDNRRLATYYVTSLSSPSERHKLAIPGGTQGVLSLSTSNDRVLYNKRGTITLQTLDQKTLELRPPVALADGWSAGTASRTGTVVFRSSEYPTTQLLWVDRAGHRLSTVGTPDRYLSVELSPTATRAAVVHAGPWIYDMDLWLADLATGVFTPLTDHTGVEADPVWSPDERRLAYSSDQDGHRLPFVKDLITGAEDKLVDADDDIVLDDWTADGRLLIVRERHRSVSALPMTREATLRRLVATPSMTDQSQVSPDGHWIAYQSVESDPVDVYAAEFPSFSGRRQVSIAGGSQPRWRADGKELFYLAADNMMMSVGVGSGTFATPRPLFQAARSRLDGLSQYDVTPDGQRFLIVQPIKGPREGFTFLLNWISPDSK